MAEVVVNPLHEPMSSVNDPDKDPNNLDPSTTLFHRRIEFHLARKPFTGFGDGGNSSGFKLETLNPNNSNSFSKLEPQRALSGSGSGSLKALGSSLENSGGLDSEFGFRITFNRIGAGLENLGNTCFLNSVLQCLTYTEPLAAYLQSGRHKTACRTAGFCALCAIQKHVNRALESTGRILAPKDLVSNLRCISRNFRNSRQEDAHEYMVNLLESMHKCCLPSGVPSESPSAYEKSLVHKIFGGHLRSQVKCAHCSFCSNKFDPFLDLSLEIWKADSLDKALAHFTAKELLDGGERQYQCQQCKQKVRAVKQLTVFKASQVLTIHLKRFGSHVNQKIDKHMKFDTTLDLKPYVTGPYDGDLKYTLYGVLVHAGWNTRAGHYYCFVRTSSGNWYSLDDNRVVQVGEKKVLEQKAYMLFYVRDRTYSVSKKNVDVLQKESMIMNVLGNKAYSSLNHRWKETIQHESFGKKINDSFSAAVAQKHTLNAHSSAKSLAKLDFVKKVNDPVAAECSSLKKGHPTETSLNLPPKIDSFDVLPVSNLTGRNFLLQSGSSVEEKHNNSVTAANSADMGSNAQKDMAAPLSAERDYNEPQNAAGKESNSMVTRAICNGNTSRRNYLNGSGCNLSNMDFLHESSGERSILRKTNTGEVEGFSGLVGIADSAGCQNVHELGKEKPVPTVPTLGCKKSLNAKCYLVKKRHPKRPVMRMHLSSNIIFGEALRRKKNKHRKRRRAEMHVGNSLLSSDFGPSTSEKSKTPNICSAHSPGIVKCGAHEKGNSSSIKNCAGNGDMLRAVMDSELRNKVNNDGAALLNNTELQKGSCTTSGNKPCDSGEPGGTKGNRKNHVENGLMSMLTRGLEETTVARWDGVELPPSEFEESRSADNISIGYVADEWDEEYDRGKRKKIRNSKLEFGGPNPFQEVAIKKAKIKKHSSSANQPFRI